MLKQRIITGALLGIVFLLCLFFLPWLGFTVFVALVLLIGAWEWANLASFETLYQRLIYTAATLLLMICVAFYVGMDHHLIKQTEVRNVLLVAGTWWALALLWVQGYPSSTVLWGSRWVRALMGWLVLIPSWLSLSYLHQYSNGSWLILLVMMIVVIADSGAYFSGKAFGRRKLVVQVSPGKSWEGFWGGLFCCSLLGLIVASSTGFKEWLSLFVIVLLTALASVLGDLLESMIKRHRDVKDSGTILPGHGGVLDRIDSITAAAPIFTLGVILSGWSL